MTGVPLGGYALLGELWFFRRCGGVPDPSPSVAPSRPSFPAILAPPGPAIVAPVAPLPALPAPPVVQPKAAPASFLPTNVYRGTPGPVGTVQPAYGALPTTGGASSPSPSPIRVTQPGILRLATPSQVQRAPQAPVLPSGLKVAASPGLVMASKATGIMPAHLQGLGRMRSSPGGPCEPEECVNCQTCGYPGMPNCRDCAQCRCGMYRNGVPGIAGVGALDFGNINPMWFVGGGLAVLALMILRKKKGPPAGQRALILQ